MPHNERWEHRVIESLSNELRKANDLLDLNMEEAAESRLRLAMMKGKLREKNKKIQQLQAIIRQLCGEDKVDDEFSCYSQDLTNDVDDDFSLESATIDSLDLTKERSARSFSIPSTLIIFSDDELKNGQGVSTPLPNDSRPVSKMPKAA